MAEIDIFPGSLMAIITKYTVTLETKSLSGGPGILPKCQSHPKEEVCTESEDGW